MQRFHDNRHELTCKYCRCNRRARISPNQATILLILAGTVSGALLGLTFKTWFAVVLGAFAGAIWGYEAAHSSGYVQLPIAQRLRGK